MDEQEKQNIGDGSDNFIEGAKKAAEAAKTTGGGANPAAPKGETGATQAQQTAQRGAETSTNAAQKGAGAAAETAAKGAEATANSAAAAVKAGAETGKAVSEIAAGTAAGGPWGAIIAAAWAMRNTLFKIIICICLALLFLVSMVVSLPSIMFNYIFRTDPASAGVPAAYDIYQLFEEMSNAVGDCVTAGYDYAFVEVERIISDGGYNYEYSMQALINHGATSAEYDICYVLAAYSVAMEQRGTTKDDMIDKLTAAKSQMFDVTYTVKKTTITILAEDEDDEDAEIEIDYVECTIHPFDQSVILTAFGIDLSAKYSQFNITCGEAITNMANALKLTMYGAIRSGSVPLITDDELNEFIDKLICSQLRKDLLTVAVSLVERVPYFWGGKSTAGWNDDWNTPKVVTSIGSSSTGTLRPYGLDCTGFTDWAYKTALGTSIGEGSWNQWENSTTITKNQLLPGDLGFMAIPGTSASQHVLMYAGKDPSGNLLWVHCEWGIGVHINSPNYVKYYRRPNIYWEE